MEKIEIYKDIAENMWKDEETFLCVFDENNNLLADYDFCTGLKLMQDGEDIVVFIKDEDLISGQWIFFGTKVNKDLTLEKIKVSGKKDGFPKAIEFIDKEPWNSNCASGNYTSRQEREERLSICKSCPLFDSLNITCKVDDKIVLQSTKYEDSFCPEEKWGSKKAFMTLMANIAKSGDIIMPEGAVGPLNDQASFEEDLDRYLEGLE